MRRSTAERFQELTAAWEQGDGCASGARRLVAALESEELGIEPPADLLQRLKTLLIARETKTNRAAERTEIDNLFNRLLD